jgi:HK97 family phage major capsid protein
MKSPGKQITDMLIEKPERRRFDIAVDRKAATPILAYPPTYETVDRVIPGRTWQYRMRSLITPGSTVGSGIVYVRETSFTTNTIVPVAPGAPKPQPVMTYDVQQQPVITIPAYLKLPSQYWQDFAMLQSWMDSRLMYGLALAEENQFLNGNGTAPNLQGFMAVALTAPAPTPAPTPGAAAVLAGVASGIASVYGQAYAPNGIVLNPNDFGLMLFALGTPTLVTTPITLWGIPVVATQAMASGSYLVGQFDPYSQIFDREEAAVEVADQNEDDFIRDLVTVRAEERLALAIYQPSAFAKGTFLLS